MRAYKGFKKQNDGTLWRRGFKYEVGKTYEVGNVYKFEGKPILCEQGFHACHEPHQCWVHYPNNGENVYYEVECGGTIVESNDGDGKFVCTEITLVKEIPAPENKFDYCWDFYNGCAEVMLDDKYNFIDTEGKYLFEQWFDDCWYFQDGYGIVMLDDKWNFIDTKGKYLSEQWFDDCCDFHNGCAIVMLDDKYNFINTDGKLISEQWFDDCCSFFRDGYAEVKINDGWYQIDKNGKII